jgi:uncharacterized protein
MPDDFESLLKDIAYADRIPHAALRAAMGHAATLASRVEALARRYIAGEWLYPPEEYLLFYGLFVLAAAKERAIWPAWLDMMRQDGRDVSVDFGDGAHPSICAITLSLVDEDIAAIVDLIEDARTAPGVAAQLVSALTRLTCEGRYQRPAFVSVIDRLASRIEAAPTPDTALDVEEAITLGGIAERADLLERLLEGVLGHWRDQDKAESRAILADAAANPGDLARFDEAGIAALRDPGDALRWLERREEKEDAEGNRAVPLSWRERERLVELLQSAAPEQAMGLEEIDGLFHALVFGPELPPLSEYLPLVFGEPDDFDFAGVSGPDHALDLLQRHWNTIVQRRWDHATPRLCIEPNDDHAPGDLWSRGFTLGVDLRHSLWDAIPDDDPAADALGRIELLGEDLLPHERTEFLEGLPNGLAEIGAYWEAMRRLPVRVQKVGRNEPCPCGSGKKWKKCCGAAAH